MNVVEARVHGVVIEKSSGANVVILREAGGERILPIWIGPGEAQAISRLLSGEAPPRPFTHDLLAMIVEGLKGRVTRVVISDLRESTFFAHLFVEREGEVLSVDARPSDSIAVALRTRAPIYVNELLMQDPPTQEAEAEPTPEPPAAAPDDAEQLRRRLERLKPEDFGKFEP